MECEWNEMSNDDPRAIDLTRPKGLDPSWTTIHTRDTGQIRRAETTLSMVNVMTDVSISGHVAHVVATGLFTLVTARATDPL